jgi:hypothetical protein
VKPPTTFIFDSYKFDGASGILLLRYSYDDTIFFEEQLLFPRKQRLSSQKEKVLANIFRWLHLAAGISYYKLFVPQQIQVRTGRLSEDQASFFNNFYSQGLGEFAYCNKLGNLQEHIKFPYSARTEERIDQNFLLPQRRMVPLGGGKDSLVVLEMLKLSGEKPLVCCVEGAEPIPTLATMSGCEYFFLGRKISKNLLDFNKQLEQMGGFNGHVPITGILAFVLVVAAVLVGYDTVLMANERSANVENLILDGWSINHQWSKSWEFEKQLDDFVKKYLLPQFNYVSLLRPLAEIHVVKMFAQLRNYHKVFCSCNGNYRQSGKNAGWCCCCAKCRFVFLALAVYLNKPQLLDILGENLLEQEGQLEGFAELCGLKNHKPFECVGEVVESVYALCHVHQDFVDDVVVRRLRPLLVANRVDEQKLFTPVQPHGLVGDLWSIFSKAVKILGEDI